MDKFCIIDSIYRYFVLGSFVCIGSFAVLLVPAKRLVAVRLITVFDVIDFVASTGSLTRCFLLNVSMPQYPVSSIEPKSGTERLNDELKFARSNFVYRLVFLTKT